MVYGTAIIWTDGDIMHFEILTEDISGKKLLEALLPGILGNNGDPHTWRIIPYKGVGHIPRDLRGNPDPSKRLLLSQLPRLLAGYGNTYPEGMHNTIIVVVVDCDNKHCTEFLRELNQILNTCMSKPRTLFRLAIEECEAWLLGDRTAITKAYPRARKMILDGYVQDSICGTWEKLADAIYPGGAAVLESKPYFEIGTVKCEWAEKIGPHINIESNISYSFGKLRDGLRRFAGMTNTTGNV